MSLKDRISVVGDSFKDVKCRSSKSVSMSEAAKKEKLHSPVVAQEAVVAASYRTFRDINQRRSDIIRSINSFSADTNPNMDPNSHNLSSLSPNNTESTKSKKICLKKYNDIISEIDNMKLKISKISKENNSSNSHKII